MGDNNNLYYESENGEASVNVEGSNSEDSRVASPIDVANNHAYRDPYTNEILYGKADLYKLNKTIEPGEIYTLPDGFHEGTIIKAKDITDFTYGTATAADIAFNKTAWVNGKKVIGTSKASNIPELSATVDDVVDGKTFIGRDRTQATGTIRKTVGHGNDKTITEPINLDGYYKDVTISPIDMSEDDATADHLLLGYTAHSKGKKIVGTMHLGEEAAATISTSNQAQPEDVLETKRFARPQDDGMDVIIENGKMKVNPPQNIILDNGDLYNIPNGYHNGAGVLTVPTLASKTPGDLVKSDLPIGRSAWVNGKKIVANYKRIPHLNDLNNDVENGQIEVDPSDKYINQDGGINFDLRNNRKFYLSDYQDKMMELDKKRRFLNIAPLNTDNLFNPYNPLYNSVYALPSSARAYGSVKNVNGRNKFVRNTKGVVDPTSLSSIIYNRKLLSIDNVLVNLYNDKNELVFSACSKYDVSIYDINERHQNLGDKIIYYYDNTNILYNNLIRPKPYSGKEKGTFAIYFSKPMYHDNDDGFGNFSINLMPTIDTDNWRWSSNARRDLSTFIPQWEDPDGGMHSNPSEIRDFFITFGELKMEVKFFGINYEE